MIVSLGWFVNPGTMEPVTTWLLNIITRPCPHGKTHNTNAEIILRSRNTLGPKRDPKQSISPSMLRLLRMVSLNRFLMIFVTLFCCSVLFRPISMRRPAPKCLTRTNKTPTRKTTPARYSKAGVSPLPFGFSLYGFISQGASLFKRMDVSLPTFARWHCGRFRGKK